MKLIAVISHKGGAGKTTSAVQLAEELARRGQRTLLVDADRQQGAGLLLGIDSPAGCVQQTFTGNLSYLGSARLTDLEIADCYASVADRFDVGVVDTPSLDDVLARAWLREATAVLMVLQVDPLTVKTLPSALNTLEVVRALKPSIQILGLLPTMFDQQEDAHGRLLTELLGRKPDAVFTPVVPVDPGLRHRANRDECPPIAEAARQAYECAVDRILRALEKAEPSVSLGNSPARPRPPWAQAPVQTPPIQAPAAFQTPPAPAPAAFQPPVEPAPAPYQPPVEPAPAPAPPDGFTSAAEPGARPAAELAPSPVPPPAPSGATLDWDDESEAALETLAASRVEEREPARKKKQAGRFPEWYRENRIDDRGVARRPESWLVRSRFVIACTIACLALIAAVVLGTLQRAPATAIRPLFGRIPAAVAATPDSKDGAEKPKPEKKTKERKSSPGKGSRAAR